MESIVDKPASSDNANADNFSGSISEDLLSQSAITVGGQTLYVVTSPEDVGAIYRNNTTLSWDAMLNDLLVVFGVNRSVVPKLWQKPFIAERRSQIPSSGLSPVHSTLDLYKRQLLPGERLESISQVLLGNINSTLRWEKMTERYGAATQRISLKDFCSEVLVDALTRTLFGNRIYEVEPNLVQNLLDFNDDAWMLIFHYPQSSKSKLFKARAEISRGFVKYIQGEEDARSGCAWLIRNIMEEQAALDIGDEDRAALLLMIYWA